MSIQREFICGLSHEVTIAVLPRLNIEELMFELNRRIQNLDNENSIKDRLVSILRDVMLEEYSLLERKSEVNSPDETNIPVQNQETATMQGNVLTACAETKVSHTASHEASQQSSGLDIAIKKENDVSSEVLVHTKELELDTDNVHLIVTQQDQICNMPSPVSPTISACNTIPTHMDNTADSRIKEEDFDMMTEDESGGPCHDEFTFDTNASSTQVFHVLDTLNPMNTSCTENTVESDTPRLSKETALTSRQLHPDDGDVNIKMECHVSQDEQIVKVSQPSKSDQTENYADDRDRETGFINSGHVHEHSRKDSSEEIPLARCEPTPDQDSENMSSHLPDNDSRLDAKGYVCDVYGFNTTPPRYIYEHKKRHKGEKPFMCGECDYRAYHNCRLVEHMRKHTGEKPFKCKECSYSTAYKGDLVKHLRYHTSERPYSCQECDYKTKDRSNLAKHIRNKHQ
uniref:C2H2-type domain-containing protein n=1 Tax=Branchiostoma floridae TaxID=7739 RepID=C3YUM3_BRAFL|eukprot:XP_002599912.1 hypothetical protein BRAFLDRAFT_74035 [Branchiostoma floridae]